MRLLCVLIVVVCAIPASAQVTVREDQVLEVSFDASANCARVCDQPAGTAGFRVVLDGAVIADLGVPTFPHVFDLVLPGVGMHAIAMESYNCRSGCSVGEQVTRGPSATFEVVPADPAPPPVVPAPVLTVRDP